MIQAHTPLPHVPVVLNILHELFINCRVYSLKVSHILFFCKYYDAFHCLNTLEQWLIGEKDLMVESRPVARFYPL